GLEEAVAVSERCRLKALRPAALHSLREEEASRPDQDLVRRHRRATVVPPRTRPGFRLRGGSTGDEAYRGGLARSPHPSRAARPACDQERPSRGRDEGGPRCTRPETPEAAVSRDAHSPRLHGRTVRGGWYR